MALRPRVEGFLDYDSLLRLLFFSEITNLYTFNIYIEHSFMKHPYVYFRTAAKLERPNNAEFVRKVLIFS